MVVGLINLPPSAVAVAGANSSDSGKSLPLPITHSDREVR